MKTVNDASIQCCKVHFLREIRSLPSCKSINIGLSFYPGVVLFDFHALMKPVACT